MTKAPIMSREARLAWARGIVADVAHHSDARLRRACLTILNHLSSSEVKERKDAQELLGRLEPDKYRQRGGYVGDV